MTSQIRGGLTGFRTWLHTRWCFFFLFCFFMYAFVQDETCIWQRSHMQSRDASSAPQQFLGILTGGKKKTLGFKTGAQKVTKCQRWAGGLTSSIPLLFSNDALQKMSNQLSAFPLTFHWQIGKQTHNEEPAGLDGWWLRPMLRWS